MTVVDIVGSQIDGGVCVHEKIVVRLKGYEVDPTVRSRGRYLKSDGRERSETAIGTVGPGAREGDSRQSQILLCQ